MCFYIIQVLQSSGPTDDGNALLLCTGTGGLTAKGPVVYVLGSKFCIFSVEILCFRVKILYFRAEILYFRIEILYFGNQIGNFSKIQTSSLPRNTNSVTTSEPKFRHCLKIQTTSGSKFRHHLRIKIW